MSRPGLGLLLGFEDTMADFVELAREGEGAGMESMYTVEAGRSAFVSAAAVIAATERVTVGTYIANAYAREPWLTAIAARDLDELSGGRFTLGLGTGNRHFNEWYMGVDDFRPLGKLRDYIEIVRSAVAGRAGEPVRCEGDHHRIRWRATWEPTRPSIPVYLSASGPKMVRLAGEVADGVGVGVMSSAEFMRDIVRPAAQTAATEAGRDSDSVGFLMGSFLSVNNDEELARNATKTTICGLFHPVPHPYYDSQLRQLGFADFADAAARLMPEGQIREAIGLVPDEVVDTMTITGTPTQCADRIADYSGLTSEIILFRVAQRTDPPGLAGYESLFEVIVLAAS
ncbi:LLM class flavin-dependent oxidoreductase [Candidatus Poriferisodalis sp.]|uniref:LLM class flavin-dependent oxidoreductase n=1 Tax=Candidatus Poriferisodalis sp. TaxID=3101277 RepID=UPI003B01B0D4